MLVTALAALLLVSCAGGGTEFVTSGMTAYPTGETVSDNTGMTAYPTGETVSNKTGAAAQSGTDASPGQQSVTFPRNLAAYLHRELRHEAGAVLRVTDFFDTEALKEKEGLTDEMLRHLQMAKPLTEAQLMTAGTYPVEILAGEMSLNTKLTVQDTTPPVITLPGVLTVKRGETISYKQGVTVTDNSGAEITPEVNIDEVMVNMEGTYPVYYRATDPSGNTAEAVAQITIEEAHIPTEEENRAIAEALLEEIVTDGMSAQEKAAAVFDWCHDNITPRPRAVNWDTVYGIYDGLYYREGNCFTSFVTSTYLLELLDIPYRRVTSRLPSGATHVWSLVQVESGWYHFDTTKLAGAYCCLLQTDAQVNAYAAAHPETGTDRFRFSEEGMPERSTLEIVESSYRTPAMRGTP
ncbi:MAG: transglutaminase domain-containing protein [Lachnospiraceae bacterium]|nr:transglutaminase domain-containing protein [Lachnospiraceae bacterium]